LGGSYFRILERVEARDPLDPVPSMHSEARRVPVLVELFTSEGCSSCPPADRLLARLVREQPIEGAEIIALEEHVDYWNRLGWADPFSSGHHSARQQEYARAFGKAIYTPQMVVDGWSEFVGSDARRLREAIERATQAPKADVRIARTDSKDGDGAIALQVRVEQVPQVAARDGGAVFLAITEDDLESSVTRGENAGRRLTHVAVVRSLQRMGKLDDKASVPFERALVVDIRPEWNREKLRAVVFVQDLRRLRIFGAAAIALGNVK
jgi:hypothetical protein